MGPLIGGLFAEHTTWRWVFYINFPFCAIGLVVVPVSVRLTAEVPSLRSRLTRFDWTGMVLFTASSTSVLMPITWGGSQFPWDSWHALVPIIVGTNGPGCGCDLGAAYTCALLQGIMLFCTLYYLPIYFQGVQSYSPTLTGLGLMPITGSLLPFSILVALIIRKTGHFRWAIWSGWAISTLSSGLLILLSAETRVYAWVLIFIVVGLGHGLILIALNICTQALVHESDVVHAAVMYTFARSVGILFSAGPLSLL
ncbi:hypothetical protein G6O67_004349 [Ophiocordyceps sinensis]|uniref:Major facilitator superfamily domain, general substrate transporter n=1 Tax=Ophiocordyceps sinensis TaxID=72228 RepID=A0A8H4LYJ3_9HYPO|nr:hypothetical protein G6O67_004349 [Ophiocordyceps sinensis]